LRIFNNENELEIIQNSKYSFGHLYVISNISKKVNYFRLALRYMMDLETRYNF